MRRPERTAPMSLHTLPDRVPLAPPSARLLDVLCALTDFRRDRMAELLTGRLAVDGRPASPGEVVRSVARARERAPVETWELLAVRGLIPMGWVEDPTRRFACAACGGRGEDLENTTADGRLAACVPCQGRGVAAHPLSVADAIAAA